MKYMIDSKCLPSWFRYPPTYLRIVEQSLLDLTPWHILSAEDALRQMHGFEDRYPSRRLVPFARRQDNDDVACWEDGKPEMIVVVHDYASEGWENEGSFDSFWSWFRSAVEDTIDWD